MIQLGMVVGGSGALGALVKGVFSRPGKKADATAVLSEASIRQVESMQEDLNAAKEQIHEFQKALWAHQKWDMYVVAELHKQGVVDIPPPPDLWL